MIENLPAIGTLLFYVQAAYLNGESPNSEIILLSLAPPSSPAGGYTAVKPNWIKRFLS